MRRLMISSIPIPEIYIVDNQEDIYKCKEHGIPYIIGHDTDDKLIKLIMIQYMQAKYPHINGEKEYNLKDTQQPMVCCEGGSVHEDYDNFTTEDDIGCHATKEYREFSGGHDEFKEQTADLKLGKYIGDISKYINLDVLLKLELLPQFMKDISKAIRINITKTKGTQGYHKKYKLCVGKHEPIKQPKNLIILDVSGSIPRGISDTMITLLNTMKHELIADVIITSSQSKLGRYEDKLPAPQTIRNMFGYGNESKQFAKILTEQINNEYYNNIISFGDYDSPDGFSSKAGEDTINKNKLNIHANNVYHYHTDEEKDTGYARGCKKINPHIKSHHDTSWCTCIG